MLLPVGLSVGLPSRYRDGAGERFRSLNRHAPPTAGADDAHRKAGGRLDGEHHGRRDIEHEQFAKVEVPQRLRGLVQHKRGGRGLLLLRHATVIAVGGRGVGVALDAGGVGWEKLPGGLVDHDRWPSECNDVINIARVS